MRRLPTSRFQASPERDCDELCRRIGTFVASGFSHRVNRPAISRARYREALITCREAILAACETGRRRQSCVPKELRRASDALGRITGMVDVEDLLDVIFREFCIGK